MVLFSHESLRFPHFTSISPSSLSLPGPTQLSSALMFDAVHVVVGAVRELNRSQEIGVKPLSCSSPQIWQHGTSLMNYLRMVIPPPEVCLHISLQTLRNIHMVWFIVDTLCPPKIIKIEMVIKMMDY